MQGGVRGRKKAVKDTWAAGKGRFLDMRWGRGRKGAVEDRKGLCMGLGWGDWDPTCGVGSWRNGLM